MTSELFWLRIRNCFSLKGYILASLLSLLARTAVKSEVGLGVKDALRVSNLV